MNSDAVFRLSNLTFFYPTSPSVKLQSTQIWSHSGGFNTSATTADFSSALQSALSACTPDGYGFCLLPLTVYSGSRGIINLTNLNIQLETTIACSGNAGCDDDNPCSADTCVSPGTALSYCTNGLDYDPCCVTAANCPWTNMTCVNSVCTAPTTAYCGDGDCNGGETAGTCCIDCGCSGELVCANNTCAELPESGAYCGDGVCAGANETAACCADCGCAAERRCVSNICVGMECPLSCDDGNDCTTDYCSSATNYFCAHGTIPNCCGNSACEPSESCATCTDCSCADGYRCEGVACAEITCAVAGESCGTGCCSGLVCCNGVCKASCLTINGTLPGTGGYLPMNITLNNATVEVEVSREFDVLDEELGQVNLTVEQIIEISSASVPIDRLVEVSLRMAGNGVVYETRGKKVEYFLFFPVEVPKNVVVNATSGEVISVETKSSLRVFVENLIDMIVFWA